MIVYVNGCSYANASDGKVYGDFLGEIYKCDTINSSMGGCSNTRIIRSSLRDLIELKKNNNDIVAVISLSFLNRIELWDIESKQHIKDGDFAKFPSIKDGDFVQIQTVNKLDWYDKKQPIDLINNLYKDYIKQWLTWYNVEAETVNLLQQILSFAGWCKYKQIKYVIFSGPLQESIDFNSPFVESFYNEMVNDPQIINIFEESFTEWCYNKGYRGIDDYNMEIHGKTYKCGHLGEEAHQAWANYLVENYL